MNYQHVIRRIPVPDNVIEYAVNMVAKTRPESNSATDLVKQYVDLSSSIKEAVGAYIQDVRSQSFPDSATSFK